MILQIPLAMSLLLAILLYTDLFVVVLNPLIFFGLGKILNIPLFRLPATLCIFQSDIYAMSKQTNSRTGHE